MQTTVINLIGGPSAGKTTIAALIFAELKLRGKVTEYVPEYAKKLVWLEEFETLDNQHYVSSRQFKLMKSMVGKVEYVVTDGSLLHGLYYNRFNPNNTSDKNITETKILEYFHSFKNINIVLSRGDFAYEQAGRIQTESQAREIDKTLLTILNNSSIPYTIFDSSPTKIHSMVEYILNAT
jgi:hypothetical protein